MKGMRERMQDFLVLSQGFGSSPSAFSRARWRKLVRAECLRMIVGGWFLFYRKLMLLWVTGMIWEHLHSFREVKCLQGCSKILWIGLLFFKLFFRFMKFVSKIRGAWNFEISVKDSDNGGPIVIAVRIKCLFLFHFWYVTFV